MADQENELLDIDVEQPLGEVAADLRTIADDLDAADDELTITYGDESATVPTPTEDVEFELEVEAEQDGDHVEYEIEFEIEWAHHDGE